MGTELAKRDCKDIQAALDKHREKIGKVCAAT